MAAVAENKLRIKDMGTIHEIEIDFPEDGGIIVLRGRNDIGKSVALNNIEALLTGEGKVEKRDGALRGDMSLGEATISCTKTSRRSGKIAFSVLDSGMKLGDLISPSIADPEKADNVRIKALLTVVGDKPDKSIFYPLLGGKDGFDAIVTPAALKKSGDIVELAAAIKRDIEAAARAEASLAEQEAGHAQGHREAAKGYDPAIETDQEELDRELHEAIKENGQIEQLALSCATAKTQRDEAQAKLEKAQSAYDGPTVDEAQQFCEVSRAEITKTYAVVTDLQEKLEAAKTEYGKAVGQDKLATEALKRAKEHAETISGWKAAIDGSLPESPSESEVAVSSKRVRESREAVEAGALNRERKKRVNDAEQAENSARQHREKCEELRQSARGIDDLLSGEVAKTGSVLRVEHGRLVLDDEKDGAKRVVPYGDLSDGRRTRIALDIVLSVLARSDKPPRFTLDQHWWSELDVFNRREIDAWCKEKKCVIITAEATQDDKDDDGTIKVEQFAQAV